MLKVVTASIPDGYLSAMTPMPVATVGLQLDLPANRGLDNETGQTSSSSAPAKTGISKKLVVERQVGTESGLKTITTLSPHYLKRKKILDGIQGSRPHEIAYLDFRVRTKAEEVEKKLEREMQRAAMAQNNERQLRDCIESNISASIPFSERHLGFSQTLHRTISNQPIANEEPSVHNQQTEIFYCIPSREENAGQAWLQGERPAMEDRHAMGTLSFDVCAVQTRVRYSLLCDGHGGVAAADFVKNNVRQAVGNGLKKFASEELSKLNIFNAMKYALSWLDYSFDKPESGTTVNLCLQIDNWLITANTGDSRAILVARDGSARQLSDDAKPGVERFARRIRNRGGAIVNKNGILRVDGMYALAGAVGDHRINGHMPARPKITMIDKKELSQDERKGIIVQVCDGVTDVHSTREIARFTAECLRRGDPPNFIAAKLCTSAYRAGSMDNISTVIHQIE